MNVRLEKTASNLLKTRDKSKSRSCETDSGGGLWDRRSSRRSPSHLDNRGDAQTRAELPDSLSLRLPACLPACFPPGDLKTLTKINPYLRKWRAADGGYAPLHLPVCCSLIGKQSFMSSGSCAGLYKLNFLDPAHPVTSDGLYVGRRAIKHRRAKASRLK